MSIFKQMTLAKWFLLFVISVLVGILLYGIAIKIAFNPDFDEIHNVGVMILSNLTNPILKQKAYLCVGILSFLPLIVFLWFLVKLTLFYARKAKQ